MHAVMLYYEGNKVHMQATGWYLGENAHGWQTVSPFVMVSCMH